MPSKMIALLLASALLAGCSTPRSVRAFYQANKQKEGVKNVSIPGWLVSAGVSVAQPFVEDEKSREALALARKVTKMQLMIDEDGHQISRHAIRTFTEAARADGFEDLLLVRDGETVVNVMVVERHGRLRRLVFLIRDESDFIFLHLRTALRLTDIAEAVKLLLDDEEEDPAPDRTRKIPQV